MVKLRGDTFVILHRVVPSRSFLEEEARSAGYADWEHLENLFYERNYKAMLAVEDINRRAQS